MIDGALSRGAYLLPRENHHVHNENESAPEARSRDEGQAGSEGGRGGGGFDNDSGALDEGKACG